AADLVEIIELPQHPWFVGTQAHPEFKSRPTRPAPLYAGFIEACMAYAQRQGAGRELTRERIGA
ncbi:MAG: hypothetical protein M3007_08895, partial [Candidatus Eremiobacteraeota bacterium]|nr:hypothetical protein [Candidatus Eremiobacteraeota bacterium]